MWYQDLVVGAESRTMDGFVECCCTHNRGEHDEHDCCSTILPSTALFATSNFHLEIDGISHPTAARVPFCAAAADPTKATLPPRRRPAVRVTNDDDGCSDGREASCC
jgi:hypothetical protein